MIEKSIKITLRTVDYDSFLKIKTRKLEISSCPMDSPQKHMHTIDSTHFHLFGTFERTFRRMLSILFFSGSLRSNVYMFRPTPPSVEWHITLNYFRAFRFSPHVCLIKSRHPRHHQLNAVKHLS